MPILAVIGLWVADLLGKRFFIVRQAGRFVLVGAFADVIDIKVFQLLFIFAPFSIFFKTVSFIIATIIKYFANKRWAFEKPEGGQALHFFLVTLVGLAIDVVSFYYLGKIKVGLSTHLWVELTIIFAALIAAIWNFLGYKFLVFKK